MRRIGAVFGMILTLGLAGCNECKEAKNLRTELQTLRSQLDEAAAVPVNSSLEGLAVFWAVDDSCTWFGKVGAKNLDRGAAQADRVAQDLFFKVDTECLKEEVQRTCRPTPGETFCHTMRICLEEKTTPRFLDGYQDAKNLANSLRDEKAALQNLCSAQLDRNLPGMRAALTEALQTLNDLRAEGDVVLKKSGCTR